MSKTKKIILVIVILVVIGFLVVDGYRYYQQWKGEKKVEKLAEFLRQTEKAKYEKQAADTVGGKTPQETLELFIKAVEEGNYELASKYFVIEKQEAELESLKTSKKENIENIMSILKRTKLVDKRVIFEKMYEGDVKQYSITESKDEYLVRIGKIYEDKETMTTKVNGYNFDVNFVLYPSGNWKIEKI